MGSGKRIRYSIHKHGIENHKFEILEHCFSRKEMFDIEEQIINEEFLKNPLCMNIAIGGKGGFSEESRLKGSALGNQTISDKLKEDEEYAKQWSERSKKTIVKMKQDGFVFFDGCRTSLGMLGKNHSDETKEKMKEAHSAENNSQYGTCWIHSLDEKRSMKINRPDLDSWIESGWISGRKIKF